MCLPLAFGQSAAQVFSHTWKRRSLFRLYCLSFRYHTFRIHQYSYWSCRVFQIENLFSDYRVHLNWHTGTIVPPSFNFKVVIRCEVSHLTCILFNLAFCVEQISFVLWSYAVSCMGPGSHQNWANALICTFSDSRLYSMSSVYADDKQKIRSTKFITHFSSHTFYTL